MRHLLKILFLSFATISVQAEVIPLPKWDPLVNFQDTEKNKVTYSVGYPSGPRPIIRDGRLTSQQPPFGDCMVITYGGITEIPVQSMIKLAESLEVGSGMTTHGGFGVLVPQVRQATVLFQLPNIWLYYTEVQIQTRDGQSFKENLKRILPDIGEASVVISYLRSCRELED